MKIEIDTSKITEAVKTSVDSAKTNARQFGNFFKKESGPSTLDQLETELDFIKQIIQWNKERQAAGQSPYIPKGISKQAKQIIKEAIRKEELKEKMIRITEVETNG